MADTPYQQFLFFPGTYPTTNQVVHAQTFLTPTVRWAAGTGWFTGSSRVAFTSAKSFGIYRNGTLVSTASFAASGTTATVTSLGADVVWVPGDILTIIAAGVADATGSGVAFTFLGTRS